MKQFVYVLLFLGFFGLAEGSLAVASADTKIGYVDMQQAIQKTKQGQEAKARLEKDYKKRIKALKEKENSIKAKTTELEKKALVLTDSVRKKKERELQKERGQYAEMMRASQMEIQKKERELTLPILKSLQSIIAELAQKEKYTVILEKSEQSVLWAKKELDITDQVVEVFNKKAKNKKK